MSANTTFISAPGTLNVTSVLEAFRAVVSFCDSAAVNGFHPPSECHSQVTSDLLLFVLSSSPLKEEVLDAVLAVEKHNGNNYEWA